MPPLSLSDDQLAAVFDAAAPLLPGDRSQFLIDVAAALDGQEIGDGVVARVCRGSSVDTSIRRRCTMRTARAASTGEIATGSMAVGCLLPQGDVRHDNPL